MTTDPQHPPSYVPEVETKVSYRTSELAVYVFMVVVLFLATPITELGAEQLFKYLTLLSVGYIIGRGLAKAGHGAPLLGSGRPVVHPPKPFSGGTT